MPEPKKHQFLSVPHLTAERLQALRELVPEAFSEGRIDFEKLRAALGDIVEDSPERYSFSWAGKRDAIRLLQTPTRATLIPCPEESLDFDSTQNLFIEGDNLEALKLLYKPYFGRIKMIYIDPPYNTGNDFIYPDDYSDPLGRYLELTGQQDAAGNLLTSNPETSGRYHSAWLSMMYPRLFLARQLLREDGVTFVSIDDHEVHNLRMLMNEIFGEENFVATVIWQKVYSPKSSARHFSEDHDYIVVYAKNGEIWNPSLLPRTEEMDARYNNLDNDPRGPWKPSGLDARNYYSRGIYPITCPSGRVISGPPSGSYWRVSEEKFRELDSDNRIWWGENGNSVPAIKRFLSEVKAGKVPQTLWTYKEVGHTQEAKKELLEFVQFENTDNVLDTVKPTRLIQRILSIGTSSENDEIILDFFSGSSSTAHAVLKQNREDGGSRRFIMVQFPEPFKQPETKLKTIADIGKTRIRNAIKALSGSDEGKIPLPLENSEDLGFRVYKLAPSHFKPWAGVDEKEAAAYARQMELFRDPLVEGWSAEGVLTELALKHGFSLSMQFEALPGPQSLYRISDPEREQSFTVSLAERVTLDDLSDLNLGKDELFLCRDAALDDETAANLALQCRLETI
jgi:adenine-specific DNA-methyltransferase